MMKKKKILWLVIVIVVVAIIIIFGRGRSVKVEYLTEEAALRDLTRTVSATGSVKSAEEINLSFSASGRIGRVNVAVGETVGTSAILAQLDTALVSAEVANAQASVKAAAADLERVESGASTEEIAVTEQQAAQAQADWQQAKNSLTSLLKERDDKLVTYRETALNNLAAKNFYSRAALDVINTILDDDDASSLLSARNIQYKNFVIEETAHLDDLYTTIDQTISAYNSTSGDSEILAGLTTLIDYQSNIATLLTSAYLMLENSLTSASFSQSELDAYKSSVRTQQTNLDTALTALQTAKTNLSNSVVYYESQVSLAEDTIDSKAEALAVAQAQLALKKAGPRSFEVAAAEAKLHQAEANLQTATAKLNDYIIKAPLAGTVVRLDKKVGEQASATETIITIIGESNLEIEVDIPEANIAEVQTGDQAEITLDAYGSGQAFKGHVVFIEPAETIISDVVYYQVKVAFDLPDQAIKTGMTANVDILVDQKTDVLAIPFRAVVVVGNHKEVKILTADQVETKEIETGLKDDLGYIEVIDGLSAGETVIISEK